MSFYSRHINILFTLYQDCCVGLEMDCWIVWISAILSQFLNEDKLKCGFDWYCIQDKNESI